MDVATIVSLISLPYPLTDFDISEFPSITAGDGTVRLTSRFGPGRVFHFHLEHADGRVFEMKSRTLTAVMPTDSSSRSDVKGFFGMSTVWDLDANPVKFEAATGHQILASLDGLVDASEIAVVLTPGFAAENEGYISYNQPDAPALCQAWIDFRAAQIANWELIRAGREQRSEEEIYDQLRQAIESLKDQLLLLAQGRDHNITNILAQLRALIYWDDLNLTAKNYTPLLLRVATRKSLPLPIFAMKPMPAGSAPAMIESAAIRSLPFYGSVQRTMVAQSLVDLQEAMGFEVHVELLVSSAGSAPVPVNRIMRIRDVLYDAAVTESAGHYDAGITSRLKSYKSFVEGEFGDLIVRLCQIVINLGEYVLNEVYEGKEPKPLKLPGGLPVLPIRRRPPT